VNDEGGFTTTANMNIEYSQWKV